MWVLIFCENECKTEKNLFISKQETIKHNKGNGGDETTVKEKGNGKIFS